MGVCYTRWFSSAPQAAPSDSPTFEVPAGHAKSDLSSAACNIGLNRRRDLTMRQDIQLFVDGAAKSISDVFKVDQRPRNSLSSSFLALHTPNWLDDISLAGISARQAL
jgi:hypothetical protein